MRPATFLKTSDSSETAVAPHCAEQLDAIVACLRIEMPGTICYGDLDPIKIVQTAPGSAFTPYGGPMTEALTNLIYHYGYTRAFTASPRELAHKLGEAVNVTPDMEFFSKLSVANRSRERWDSTWRVYQAGTNGVLSIEKRSTHREAIPGQYIFPNSPGRVPATGDYVSVRVPKESSIVQPGFYFAFGETVASDFDDALLARFYFNMTPDAVPELLEWLSTDLNRYRIPYRFKCLLQASLYDRRDSVVLYIAKRFLSPFLRLASARKSALESILCEGVPLFTKPLLRGLSAADEPGGGLSFGQSRSRLVAEGILAAWMAGEQSHKEKLDRIEARFRAAGMSLLTPYLNEGARDLYVWQSEN